MSALRAIHAKRRQIGLEADEDAWRDLLERCTGQRSAKGLTPKQTKAVLAELDRLGAGKAPANKARRRKLEGPYAAKIQALWIGCWNLGIVKNRSDTALNAFATKQAKVSHANWIREQRDAVAVIEALKKMLERHGVGFQEPGKFEPAYTGRPGYRIALAQWSLLGAHQAFEMSFAQYVDTIVGCRPDEVSHQQWMTVMNALGQKVRARKKEAI